VERRREGSTSLCPTRDQKALRVDAAGKSQIKIQVAAGNGVRILSGSGRCQKSVIKSVPARLRLATRTAPGTICCLSRYWSRVDPGVCQQIDNELKTANVSSNVLAGSPDQ
jgi:hypothetical protein